MQRGLLMIARRPEARAFSKFLLTDMGAECRLVEPKEIETYGTGLRSQSFAAALYSPHEIRVELREAIPRLAAYLAERCEVTFFPETVALRGSAPARDQPRGHRGGDNRRLPGRRFSDAARRPDRRLRPDAVQIAHDAACAAALRRAPAGDHVGSRADPLSRLCGIAGRPVAGASARGRTGRAHRQWRPSDRRPQRRQLIGRRRFPSLAATPDPFAPAFVDDLILDEYAHVFAGDPPPVAERWTGIYASAKDRLTLVDKPSDALRIVLITSGTRPAHPLRSPRKSSKTFSVTMEDPA